MICKTVATTVDALLSNPNNVTFQESKNVRLNHVFLISFPHSQIVVLGKIEFFYTQAQLPSLGEDLLRNIENFATAVGDVTIAAVNINSSSDTTRTIACKNLSK